MLEESEESYVDEVQENEHPNLRQKIISLSKRTKDLKKSFEDLEKYFEVLKNLVEGLIKGNKGSQFLCIKKKT